MFSTAVTRHKQQTSGRLRTANNTIVKCFFKFMPLTNWKYPTHRMRVETIFGSLPCRRSITPRMSPSRAPVLSFAHYFQAPATQANSQESSRFCLLIFESSNLILVSWRIFLFLALNFINFVFFILRDSLLAFNQSDTFFSSSFTVFSKSLKLFLSRIHLYHQHKE